jgi:hypothetical protein
MDWLDLVPWYPDILGYLVLHIVFEPLLAQSRPMRWGLTVDKEAFHYFIFLSCTLFQSLGHAVHDGSFVVSPRVVPICHLIKIKLEACRIVRRRAVGSFV